MPGIPSQPTPQFVKDELTERLEFRHLTDNQENGYRRLVAREVEIERQPTRTLTPEQERDSKAWAAWLCSVEPNFQKFKEREAARNAAKTLA